VHHNRVRRPFFCKFGARGCRSNPSAAEARNHHERSDVTQGSATSVSAAHLDCFAPLAKTVAAKSRTGNDVERPRFPAPAAAIMAHQRRDESDGETSA
jgi:hypothetical protein